MNLALLQAHKSLGNTKTNPSVGCVIVKNDFLVAAGCTGITGKPHAERNAIFFNKKNRYISHSNQDVTFEIQTIS